MAKWRIEAASEENLHNIGLANEPFVLFGRLVPSLENGRWTCREELWPETKTKLYPGDEEDWTRYLHTDERTIFFAFLDETCVGQVVLRRDWNRYAIIEDICVARAARRKGVGQALLARAAQWARQQNLAGLALETQDNNLGACRFYQRCGMQIGAVNTMLYRNFPPPWSEEIAIYWYLKF